MCSGTGESEIHEELCPINFTALKYQIDAFIGGPFLSKALTNVTVR